MNQVLRNIEIQRARTELMAGKSVTAKWLTPHSGGHVTRVVLTELHHFNMYMVPFDAAEFEFERVRVVEAELQPETPVEPELGPGERARRFLLAELAIDPVPSLTLQARAKAAGIAWRTIRNVQKAVGVKVFKDKSGPWMWSIAERD
jgi:hypothetical protein